MFVFLLLRINHHDRSTNNFRSLQNLLHMLAESQTKLLFPEIDLQLLLSNVKDGRVNKIPTCSFLYLPLTHH
jgi:hypothetical protein